MFIEFSFGNFRSFREVATLSMVAAKLKSKYPTLDEDNVFEAAQGLKLLKSKAIYGANASGKSNVAKAMGSFMYLLRENIQNKDAVANVWDDRYKLLAKHSAEEAIVFQFCFLCDGVEYRYGFEILDARITSEWLFGKPEKKELAYFIKEGPTVHTLDTTYFEEALPYADAAGKSKGRLFREDSLFLLAVSVNGGTLAERLVDKITDVYVVDGLSDERLHYPVIERMDESPEFKQELLALMNSADMHISDVQPKEIDEETFKKIVPERMVKLAEERQIRRPSHLESTRVILDDTGALVNEVSGEFSKWESAGTQKFFYVGALVLSTLQEGRPFVIDEFDARLHPRLSQKIVDLFNSPVTNPHNAQLIFVTHDVGLLKPHKLRRDQIAFVDKDSRGASTLTTLAEFKGIRNDASYDKEYLLGAYGGVPIVNELETVVAKSVNRHEPEAR